MMYIVQNAHSAASVAIIYASLLELSMLTSDAHRTRVIDFIVRISRFWMLG